MKLIRTPLTRNTPLVIVDAPVGRDVRVSGVVGARNTRLCVRIGSSDQHSFMLGMSVAEWRELRDQVDTVAEGRVR